MEHRRAGIPGSPEPKVPSGLSQAEAVLYRQGHLCRAQGRRGEAIVAFRQLASRQPDLADLWAELAELYAETGAFEHALQAYRSRVRLRPGDAVAWHNLAVQLQNKARPAEAITAFREALKVAPEMSRAWYGLGTAHRRLAQHQEALHAFRQAVRFDAAYAQAWCRIGTLHEHFEEFSEAIQAYRQAVRAKPDFAVAWYNLAVLCRDEGHLPQAVEAFLQALHFKPHDTDAWVGLGMTYALQDNRKGVLAVYEELAILDVATAEGFAGQYVERSSSSPEAIALPSLPKPASTVWVTSTGANPLAEIWYAIGMSHRREGDLSTALSDFQEAVRFDPDYAKAWFCLATLYRAMNHPEEALLALREVVRLKPNLAIGWRDLGTVQAMRGQHAKAATAFRKVIELEPENLRGWLGLGRACIALENPDGLANVLERLRSIDPPCAERLAYEYAAAAMPTTLRPAPKPVFPPRQTPAPTDLVSFDTWLNTIDMPPVAFSEELPIS